MPSKRVREHGERTLKILGEMFAFQQPYEERLMAKRNDEMSVMERLVSLKKEQDELQAQVQEEFEGQLEHILVQMDELGLKFPKFLIDRVLDQYEPPAKVDRQAPLRTRNAAPGEKVARQCKICGKTGHNARTCPEKVQAPVVTIGDPRLVKASETSEA